MNGFVCVVCLFVLFGLFVCIVCVVCLCCVVCVDLNGFVNVSCYSHVCIYDPRKSYQLLQTLGDRYGSAPGQFNCPTGMCVDDLNTLMVVDHYNHRVQFFD